VAAYAWTPLRGKVFHSVNKNKTAQTTGGFQGDQILDYVPACEVVPEPEITWATNTLGGFPHCQNDTFAYQLIF